VNNHSRKVFDACIFHSTYVVNLKCFTLLLGADEDI
jgi:hypothetical protein